MIRHTEEPTGEPIPTAASRELVNARGPQCEWSCRWQDCRSPTYACCPPAHTPGNSSDASEATGNHWRMLYISVTHQCAVRLQLQLHHVHASTAVLVELLLESVNLKAASGERMHKRPEPSPTRTVMWRSCNRQRHAARSQLVHIHTQATHTAAQRRVSRAACATDRNRSRTRRRSGQVCLRLECVTVSITVSSANPSYSWPSFAVMYARSAAMSTLMVTTVLEHRCRHKHQSVRHSRFQVHNATKARGADTTKPPPDVRGCWGARTTMETTGSENERCCRSGAQELGLKVSVVTLNRSSNFHLRPHAQLTWRDKRRIQHMWNK